MFRMIARLLLAFALCTPPLFFASMYYNMHWRWRDCFNEEGRCFDDASGVVYHDQSGWIYLGMFLISLIVPTIGVWVWSRAAKRARQK